MFPEYLRKQLKVVCAPKCSLEELEFFKHTHTQGLIDSLSLFDLLPVQSQPNSLKHSMRLQRRCLSRDWCSVPKADTFTFYQLWRTDKSSGLWSSLLLMESQGWLCWVHLRAPHISLQTLLEFFFAPFSNLIALCNDNFQMNLYNMGTCPTNLIMVTANSSMQ